MLRCAKGTCVQRCRVQTFYECTNLAATKPGHHGFQAAVLNGSSLSSHLPPSFAGLNRTCASRTCDVLPNQVATQSRCLSMLFTLVVENTLSPMHAPPSNTSLARRAARLCRLQRIEHLGAALKTL